MGILKISFLAVFLFLNSKENTIIKHTRKTEDPIVSSWRVSCTNYLTELDIQEDQTARLFLYSFNEIYITVRINKSSQNPAEYEMRFKNIDSQRIYYDDKKKVIEEDLSKTNPIATFTIKGNKLTLKWIGLHNVKTKSLDFVEDAVFIRENGGKNPILFSRCKE